MTKALTTFDPIFKNLDKFMIGYDGWVDRMERLNQEIDRSTKYPPYNIRRDGDTFTIELAVAGFYKDDINISVKENQLTIKGEPKQDPYESHILYRGLANRSFTRIFTVDDHMEVIDASMENGLLKIEIRNNPPEQEKPLEITIR